MNKYKTTTILVIMIIILSICINLGEGESISASSGTSIIAYEAKIVPIIDGTKEEGEWDDTVFYTWEWNENEQDITNHTLMMQIGFKYNQTDLFVLAEINDDKRLELHGSALALLFDDDEDVFNRSTHHVLVVWNASFSPGSIYVSQEGHILSSNETARYHSEEPVGCTYNTSLCVVMEFSFKFKTRGINQTSSKLNIVYGGEDHQVSIANITKPSGYISFVFSGEKVNVPPAVNIFSPLEDQTVKGTITITGNASDADGNVQKVEIKIDNNAWGDAQGTTSWSYTWDTTKVKDGEHTISVRAYDGYDYSTIQSITVNVNNKKETPKVFIPCFETTTIILLLGIYVMLRKKKR